jgi:hypothetical protein
MKRYRWLFILVGFLVSIAGIILVNWFVMREVRRVKQAIDAAKAAVESLNIDSCMAYIAEEYTDGWGFNKQTVYVFGKNLFARTKSIEITIDKLEVQVDDRAAQANFGVQVKAVLTSEIYPTLELRDVFGTGKQKNKMMLRLVKSSEDKWQINYVALMPPAEENK